jgi:hypothetical protein
MPSAMAAAAAYEFTRRLKRVSDSDVSRLDEHFLEPARQFDASRLGDHRLFPWEMTWFYGEPIWHALPDDKKLLLNHLSFCQSYLSTAVAEAATNTLNFAAALETFLHEDPEVAHYMAREVVEETVHIQSFFLVIGKVLAHYGLALDDLRGANVSLPMARRYLQAHALLGWARGDFDYYYFTRFALNVNQKTVERCTIDEPGIDPCVRTILKNHAIDEARHMQMSRATGKVALARMRSPLERSLACVGFAHFAANVFIGRHAKDSRLTRGTRVRTLELCGIPRPEAERAYLAWRDRVNQPEDPPLVQAGRVYYLKQMQSYVDELPGVGRRTKAYMRRVIESAYADAVLAMERRGAKPLEFADLSRPA